MKGIHILVGRGDNCTCTDCSVLYGGSCWTTDTNNFLDSLERKVIEYLSFTPKKLPRKNSGAFVDKCIEVVIKPRFCKFENIKSKNFYNSYYSFLPLIYCMTTTRDKGGMYKKGRYSLYLDIQNRYESFKQ